MPDTDPYDVITALLKRAESTETHLADAMRAELAALRISVATELQGARSDTAAALRTVVYVIVIVAVVALLLMAALVGVTLQVQSQHGAIGVNAPVPAQSTSTSPTPAPQHDALPATHE